MNARESFDGRVRHNAAAHDRVAAAYDANHSEIYNPVEQARLARVVDEVLAARAIASPRVLDFGAGTGNLTLQFAARGCNVVAADVSSRSLQVLLSHAHAGEQVSTALLTSKRIPFDDESFDIVATYSVLHHVPDYLDAVAEMARVLRPGGLLYIDHEANDAAWHPSEELANYRRKTRLTPAAHLWQLIRTGDLFTPAFLKTVYMKALVDRRYEREGDLHVWPDDHVEWSKVERTLADAGMLVTHRCDYLLYRPRGGLALYREYEHRCNDTRYIVARKQIR